VLFTRDLRVHDHPALAHAGTIAERVVPLFVLDEGLLSSGFARPNRLRFLFDSLTDLDASLRALGGALVVRRASGTATWCCSSTPRDGSRSTPPTSSSRPSASSPSCAA
jgi:deoxyribodipyrimidine photo-lyase